MKFQLPDEVLSRELAPHLMRLADETDQAITVTAEGVALEKPAYEYYRCKRIESLEGRTEVSTWAA